jgi:hypothetical protein
MTEGTTNKRRYGDCVGDGFFDAGDSDSDFDMDFTETILPGDLLLLDLLREPPHPDSNTVEWRELIAPMLHYFLYGWVKYSLQDETSIFAMLNNEQWFADLRELDYGLDKGYIRKRLVHLLLRKHNGSILLHWEEEELWLLVNSFMCESCREQGRPRVADIHYSAKVLRLLRQLDGSSMAHISLVLSPNFGMFSHGTYRHRMYNLRSFLSSLPRAVESLKLTFADLSMGHDFAVSTFPPVVDGTTLERVTIVWEGKSNPSHICLAQILYSFREVKVVDLTRFSMHTFDLLASCTTSVVPPFVSQTASLMLGQNRHTAGRQLFPVGTEFPVLTDLAITGRINWYLDDSSDQDICDLCRQLLAYCSSNLTRLKLSASAESIHVTDTLRAYLGIPELDTQELIAAMLDGNVFGLHTLPRLKSLVVSLPHHKKELTIDGGLFRDKWGVTVNMNMMTVYRNVISATVTAPFSRGVHGEEEAFLDFLSVVGANLTGLRQLSINGLAYLPGGTLEAIPFGRLCSLSLTTRFELWPDIASHVPSYFSGALSIDFTDIRMWSNRIIDRQLRLDGFISTHPAVTSLDIGFRLSEDHISWNASFWGKVSTAIERQGQLRHLSVRPFTLQHSEMFVLPSCENRLRAIFPLQPVRDRPAHLLHAGGCSTCHYRLVTQDIPPLGLYAYILNNIDQYSRRQLGDPTALFETIRRYDVIGAAR